MQMEWVNHASFVLRSDATHLICDPWIDGTAFNNGWSLLSPTRFTYADFANITHIWFSHEHPDHFSPQNLRNIPSDLRRRITVLFHETKDKRVVKLCQSLGFTVHELPDRKLFDVSPGLKVISGAHSLLDSWIAFFAEGKTILNMNDCASSSTRELEGIRRVTGNVDLLLSQFSYANWVGNPNDRATHRRHADKKLEEMAMQIRVFRPAHFIPFASFVVFSHAENFFMNHAVNRISDVYEFASHKLGVNAVVLYPGDIWTVGAPHDSAAAIQKYTMDFERALRTEPSTSPSVSLEKLRATAGAFVAKCMRNNNHRLLNLLPATVIRLTDLRCDVELSFRHGLVETSGKHPDIAISSDSLLNCLATDWGGETLLINGRLELPPGGKSRRFHWIFRVPRHNSYGSTFDFSFLGSQMFKKAKAIFAS